VEVTLRNTLRGTDSASCFEPRFLVLLPERSEDGLVKTGQRIQRVVRNAGIEWWGDWLSAAVVYGGTVAWPGDTVQKLLARAQKSLNQKLVGSTDSRIGQS
jgi:PleD family two-component response regulator